MTCDAPFGPWGTTTGLTARLRELHAAPQMYSNTEIARMLSREFRISLSRNAVIGKIARLGLVHRHGASKGGGSKPGRVPPRPKPVKSFPALPALPAAPGEAKRSRVERPGTLSLLELRDGDCKWPDGDGPSFMFCGRTCVPERPYCEEHLRMAHNEPRERAA
jgi:GcrA cell cycle regulator